VRGLRSEPLGQVGNQWPCRGAIKWFDLRPVRGWHRPYRLHVTTA